MRTNGLVIEKQRRVSLPNGKDIWRMDKFDFDRPRDLARYVAREAFAWPGGYELYVVTDDSGVLCYGCCTDEYARIARSEPRDGWHPDHIVTTEVDDDDVVCDHCGKVIHEQEHD